jgi:hypothetical protein
MENNHNSLEDEFTQSRSRRSFFSWIGKIVGGASIAGIGLRIADSPAAFAADSQATSPAQIAILAQSLKFKRSKSTEPGCIDCSDCVLLQCTYDTTDCPTFPYNYLLEWEVDTGCAPHCNTTYNFACATHCFDPCN